MSKDVTQEERAAIKDLKLSLPEKKAALQKAFEEKIRKEFPEIADKVVFIM